MDNTRRTLDEKKRLAPRSVNSMPALVTLPSGKSGCGLYLAILLVVWVVASILLPDSYMLFGIVIAIPVTILIISLIHFFSKWGEWRAVRRSLAPSVQSDGERIAVFGRIYPLSKEPLHTPFGDNECVAYAYQITRRITGGRNELGTTEFEGIGMTPSSIETKHGSIRLLAWADFTSHLAAFRTSDQTDKARASQYFRDTDFVQMKLKNWRLGGGASLQTEDGSVRVDASVSGESAEFMSEYLSRQAKTRANPDAVEIMETYVPVGAEVCLVGVYSAQRHAIVSDHEKKKARVKLYEGGPEAVKQYYKPFFLAVLVLAGITVLLISLIAFLAIFRIFGVSDGCLLAKEWAGHRIGSHKHLRGFDK